jgi:hypothetical protein
LFVLFDLKCIIEEFWNQNIYCLLKSVGLGEYHILWVDQKSMIVYSLNSWKMVALQEEEWGRIRRLKSSTLRPRIFKFSKSKKMFYCEKWVVGYQNYTILDSILLNHGLINNVRQKMVHTQFRRTIGVKWLLNIDFFIRVGQVSILLKYLNDSITFVFPISCFKENWDLTHSYKKINVYWPLYPLFSIKIR